MPANYALRSFSQIPINIHTYVYVCEYTCIYMGPFLYGILNAQRPRPKSQLRIQTDGSETNQAENRVDLS